jgi:hypothetical protein
MPTARKFERVRATVEIEFIVEPAEGDCGMDWDTDDIIDIAFNSDENVVKADATFIFVETLTEAEALKACATDFRDAAVQIRASDISGRP